MRGRGGAIARVANVASARRISAAPSAARRNRPRYQKGRNRRFQACYWGQNRKTRPNATVIASTMNVDRRIRTTPMTIATTPSAKTHQK